jgi:hypothetical protein
LLEAELEDLDECVNKETVVNLIHEIALSPMGNKDQGSKNFSYSIETDISEESDSGEIIEKSHGYQVREKRAVPHKQRRKVRSRRVKQ